MTEHQRRALVRVLRDEVTHSADRERLDAAGIGDAVTVVTDASDTPYALTVALPES